jgi:hypothetical protein
MRRGADLTLSSACKRCRFDLDITQLPGLVIETLLGYALIEFSSLCKHFRELASPAVDNCLLDVLRYPEFHNWKEGRRLPGFLHILLDRRLATLEEIQILLIPGFLDRASLQQSCLAGNAFLFEGYDWCADDSFWGCYCRKTPKLRSWSWDTLRRKISDALESGMPAYAIAATLDLNPVEGLRDSESESRFIVDIIRDRVPIPIVRSVADKDGLFQYPDLGTLAGPHETLPSRHYLSELLCIFPEETSEWISLQLSITQKWTSEYQGLVDDPLPGHSDSDDSKTVVLVLDHLPESRFPGHPWMGHSAVWQWLMSTERGDLANVIRCIRALPDIRADNHTAYRIVKLSFHTQFAKEMIALVIGRLISVADFHRMAVAEFPPSWKLDLPVQNGHSSLVLQVLLKRTRG